MDKFIKDYIISFLDSNFLYFDNGSDELAKDKITNENLTLDQLKFVIYKVFNGDEILLCEIVYKWWLTQRKAFIPIEE